MPRHYLRFEYALRHPTFGFYLGTARDSLESNFSKSKRDAFTYTEQGAHVKKRNFPAMFGDCEIAKI